MFSITLFSMGTIVHCLYTGADTKVAETAVTMSFFTLIGTVGSYVFGATWQDINTVRAHAPLRRYEDEYGRPEEDQS